MSSVSITARERADDAIALAALKDRCITDNTERCWESSHSAELTKSHFATATAHSLLRLPDQAAEVLPKKADRESAVAIRLVRLS